MCGLVGAAGVIGFKGEKAFKNLLVLDTLRGEHSTGIAAVNSREEVEVVKAVGDPFILFDLKQTEDLFKSVTKVLIGHNRYATTGKITRRNAHPFEFDTLVGAHNGTLTNKYDLVDAKLFDVDSEALFHNIEKDGVKEAIGRAKGAWALTWWNIEDKTMNFLRNKERTLFYTFSEDEKTIFWASESWMLTVALSRNEIKHGKIISFDENIHYCFQLDDKFEGLSKNFTTKKIEGKKEEVFPKKSQPSGGFQRGTLTSSTLLSDFDSDYLSSSSVFRISSLQKDDDGAEYLELVDMNQFKKVVRHYPHKNEGIKNKIGYKFQGTVAGARRGLNGLVFYKVNVSGPLYLEKPKKEEVKEEEEAAIIIPKDANGNEISPLELSLYYNSCAWCSQPIDHTNEENRYMNKEVGVICCDCVKNPIVQDFLH